MRVFSSDLPLKSGGAGDRLCYNDAWFVSNGKKGEKKPTPKVFQDKCRVGGGANNMGKNKRRG
jgi:hypothetical protein